VTPGTRNTGRDANGKLIGDGSIICNGDIAASGVIHMVRDIYFEPSLGHTAGRALREMAEHFNLGRPALVEMHRFNFTGGSAEADNSLAELQQLLHEALSRFPGLCFNSTEELAEALVRRDEQLVDSRLSTRVRVFVARAAKHDRLRKLAWVSGLALLACIAVAIASASPSRRTTPTNTSGQ
jgi:hypothetical protein